MEEKKKTAIVFIDGNNVYHNLKDSRINPGSIHLGKLSQWVAKRFNCKLIKTKYYNSIPSIEDGEEVYYKHMKFISELKTYDNFEVVTRKLQRLSTKEKIQIIQNEVSSLGLCELCKPIVMSHWETYIGNVSVKEKGIDIFIAVDMIKLSVIKKECDACILISGDADFIPCLNLLKSMGIWIATSMTPKGYSYDLRQKFPWFILDKKKLIDNCSKNK